MASDYEAISDENLTGYGTKVDQYGRESWVNRYADRTHFIFELLQNAEDALKKRGSAWSGLRKVIFRLEPHKLIFSHFGLPFDEADVRSICNVSESTKDESSIGKFGIGFKSVYMFTDRPEIHSGNEDFAIKNYVHPMSVPRVDRDPDATLIILPLKAEDKKTAQEDITVGFKRLGPSALLFLQHIEEIKWNVYDGVSGMYLRSKPKTLGENVRQITVIGEESGQQEVDQSWLIFHRDALCEQKKKIDRVELAFSVKETDNSPDSFHLVPTTSSPLVVFFPTVVETHLSFLVQGPYRTTPSRDNLDPDDEWNRGLVKETAELLVDALRWFRDQSMLDTSVLSCLPLNQKDFSDTMFAPFFEAVRKALMEEPLLPRFDGGYVAAPQAMLARTQGLRKLLNSEQIRQLFDGEVSSWLTDEITQDRTPEIRQYVMDELDVKEITPEALITCLTGEFLEAQSDDWIVQLYKFLNGQQQVLRKYIDTVPIIRLSDGTHVVAQENGKPKAFLPSDTKTDFPVMRRSVCESDDAKELLDFLDIRKPDAVDDVIRNVLPKYQHDEVDISDDEYARDIKRILDAFDTDSKDQQNRLVTSLKETTFLKVIDAGDGKRHMDKPENTYLATDRLKELFAGVSNVMIVDDESYDCLRGEKIRILLEACGAVRYPRPEVAPPLSYETRRKMRQQAGHEKTSGRNDQIENWVLHGFDGLIKALPTLQPEQRKKRARLIWKSLGDLENRRGKSIFGGRYTWTDYGQHGPFFLAATFVRRLNKAAWVPDASGELQKPCLIAFEDLGWKADPFLQDKIKFKSSARDQLAQEAGIEPELIDFLKENGITFDELKEKFSKDTQEVEAESEPSSGGDVYDVARDLHDDDRPDIPQGTSDPARGGDFGSMDGAGDSRSRRGGTEGSADNGSGQRGSVLHSEGGEESVGGGKRTPGREGGRPFVSYVGTHPDEKDSDPDGLDQATRMRIEEQAIEKILQDEPELKRTPVNNPGFDLYKTDASGKIICWIEVKSMTGSLEDHSVGLSRTQFDLAREKGSAYRLYIVEHASDTKRARVLRILDPAGRAQTFTFDHGWAAIAQFEPTLS